MDNDNRAVYYGVLSAVGTTSLWWCRGGEEAISFVDCAFNAVSALTTTGLSSVLLRDFNPLGLFTLMVLMILGNTVFVSLLPVYVRRFQLFRHDSARNAASDAAAKLRLSDNCVPIEIKKTSSNTESHALGISQSERTFETGDGQCDGSDMSPDAKDSETLADCRETSREGQDSRNEVGLLEHQALATLSWLVPLYMLVIMSFGFVCIFGYTIFGNRGASKVRAMFEAEEVNPILTAIFLSISAFSNAGMSPLDENMVPFEGAPVVLGPMMVLILAGNSMFSPSLRFLIWGISTLKRPDDPQRKAYVLQFPRRCYTHLFPPAHTLCLVAIVVACNTVNLVAFCALEWNSEAVPSNAAGKVMDGLFQSISTRSAGMIVLSLSSMSPPLLVLYTAMMYIAAYPVFLSRQHSRLARTDTHPFYDKGSSGTSEEAGANKLSLQLKELFTRDSACLFVHAFLVCTLEIRSMNADPLNYSIFSIVFEVISAYGNVGFSLGYSCDRWVQASANTSYAVAAAACKDVPYSFSGKWSVGSKLILVSGMLLGRHRSLPDDMDSAIPVVTPCKLCDSRIRSRRDKPRCWPPP